MLARRLRVGDRLRRRRQHRRHLRRIDPAGRASICASRSCACGATSARPPPCRPASTPPAGEVIVTMDGDLQNDPADYPAARQAGRRLRHGPRPARRAPGQHLASEAPEPPGQLADPQGHRHPVPRLRLHASRHQGATWPRTCALRRDAPLHSGASPATSAPASPRFRCAITPRRAGKSKYGIGRTGRVLLDLLTIKFLSGYLTRPMHFMGTAGIALLLSSRSSALA